MKSSSKNRPFSPAWIVVSLGLLVTLSAAFFSPQIVTAVSDPAIAAVQQAWDKTHDSDTYTFDTHIEQTSYPLPSLSNVGHQPQTDNLFLTGERNQVENVLEMTLWQNARGSVEQGMSVRSQDGRTFYRTPAGEWEEKNELGDLFAPGGNPLTFLQTATNITALGTDSRELGGLTFTYEKYNFDLDTAAYARILREQLVAQLAQFGSLPAGMTLETPDVYRNMSGQGELWLDETGLPHRLEITLNIPPQGSNGKSIARITTDLSGFDRAQIEATAVPIWQSPQTWWQTHQVEVVAGTQQVGKTAVFLFIGIGLLLLFLAHWRSRRFYATVASILVMSMLFSPLLQVAQASGFQNNLQAAQNQAEARQAETEAQADLQNELNTTEWNPNQNPLQTTATSTDSLALAPALALTSTITDTTDTDGDGLIDSDEEHYGTCPYLGAPEGCFGVTDATDTDGDSLSDGVEIHELGTDPDNPDTDHDGIDDNLEISGFLYNGETWYLNPLEEDSNKDGLIDGQECRVRTTILPTEFDPNGICLDTDNDGMPDIFDDDNDGDGVLDLIDSAPFVVTPVYSDNDPLQLSIDNLALDKPLFVDFQLRPETVTNLNLYNHVLDWPSGDFEGQIQRTIDSTWADTDNLDLRSDTVNAANGDIRLIPMLEITMPYTDGHYANLPITTTASALRDINDGVETWLDNNQTDPMGVSINDSVDGNGVINAYLPLTQVTARDGTPQAFTTRMFYRPSQGTNGRADWGAAHEVRLIWFVQMITDQCPEGYEDSREVENDTVTYACIDPDTGTTIAREDALTIAHIYPDNWRLTGLTVSEEHDFDLAILYEDPAQDTDLTADDQLMVASWNLNNGFLNGRDCDSIDGNGVCQADGQRDVTVANLASVTPSWFSGTNYLTVDTFLDYEHNAYLAYLVGTEVKPILQDTFGEHTDLNPTLLYAQDHTYRKLTLDSQLLSLDLVTQNGNSLHLNLKPDDVPLETTSALSWTPYQYVAGEWQAADIESYLTSLDTRLQSEDYYMPEEDTEAAREEAELRRTWVQLYYASLWQGVSALTEMGNLPLHVRSPDMDIPEATYEPLILPGTDFGAVLLGFAFLEIFVYQTPGNAQTQYSFKSVSAGVSNLAFSVAVLITWAAMAVILYGMITGDQQAIRRGQVILAVVNLVIVSVYAINALNAINNAALGVAVAANNQVTSYVSIAPVGVAIGLAIIWGMFLYQVLFTNMSAIAFNVALSLAIATTVVVLVLFITSLLGFGIIGILLSLVDSIFVLLNKKGPTQYVVEYMAQSFYAIDSSVSNLSSADRLEITVEDVDFLIEADGFRTGRDVHVTMGITNIIDYSLRLAVRAGGSDEISAHNTFTYTLQEDQIPHHEGLQWVDDWYGDQWLPNVSGFKTSAVNDIVVTLPAPGLNQGLEVYYTESFRTGYYECWSFIVEDIDCKWGSLSDSVHIPLIDTLIFDVFPETVAEFGNMQWDGEALSFSIQMDQDGDSLTRQIDPDDSRFDTDGDGLGDFYEISHGYNATVADPDFDGLLDGEELTAGTNPFVADTDGDGLNDRIEVLDGWLIVYNGDQLTRVWSDPFSADGDEDGLSDRDEFIFGFNPWVPTDPSSILNLVQFDNLSVVETGAPQLLLPFEDNENSTAFSDRSGEGNHGICVGEACPAVDANGRYGQSLTFDGSNDQLTIADVDFARGDYTIAFWFQSDATSEQAILSAIGADSNNYGILVQLDATGEIRFLHRFPASSSGGTNVYSPGSYNDGQWHHLAAVHENESLRLYVDGGEVITSTTTGQSDESMNLVLGRLALSTSRWFDGDLDDLVIFDEALSAEAIDDVINGRFNPNDRLLAPGSNLTYQATVTNTSSTTAAGFLSARNNYLSPEVAYPTAAYNFDVDQRLAVFANGTGDGDSALCIDNDTCPDFGVAGLYGDGLDFSQSHDFVQLPTLGVTQGDQFTFGVWVQPDSLPASGQKMMVLDTASTEPGAIDIYLDSSGHVVWDIVGDPDPPRVSAGTLSVGSWNHIALVGHYNLFLNGSMDSSGNVWSNASFQLGHGRLGNSLEGTQPFIGQIDDLVYYSSFMYDSVNEFMGGTYTVEIINGNASQYFLPKVLYRFDSPGFGYENQANDSIRTATCPSVTLCPLNDNGRYQQGLLFDGTEDYLDLDFVLDPTGQPFSVGLWFNVSDLSNRPMLLQQTDGNGTGRGWLNLESDGRLRTYLGGSGLNSTTAVTTNSWHHAALTYDGTTLRLYLDGVEENSVVRTMEASDGNLWLGRQKTDPTRYFKGMLDELVILPTAVSPAGVDLLLNSAWPLIDVVDPFVPFAATALTNQVVSGNAPVSAYAATSQHRFEQEVEAALVLQTALDYLVIDDDAANLSLFIPFEDGPGSTVFDNLISYLGGGDPDVEALCHGNSCPTAGLRGQVERAAYFDGLNDSLMLDFGEVSRPNLHSLAVWVNAEQGTILSTAEGSSFTYELEVDVDKLTTMADPGDIPVSTPFDAPRNQWFHLAVTIDNNDVARIYINASEVMIGTHEYTEGFDRLYIGVNNGGQDYLQGYLDDLRLYDSTLTPAAVQTLYQESAPLMRFEFDEDGEALEFTDNSVNQISGQPQIITATIDGQPVSQFNPVIGTPGRIGNGIVLDGTGYVEVDAPAVAALTESFTIMSWIKPSALGGHQQIFGTTRENGNDGYSFKVRNQQLGISTFGVDGYYTADLVQNDVWQHVAVVFDSGNDATFYINGENVGKVNKTSPMIANSDDILRIGATTVDGGADITHAFKGNIDELAVHGRELSDAEIYGIYLRELRWYRDKAITYLTIDTDNPTIELLSDATYWPDGYIQLAVAATDATSAVTLLDFGLKAPNKHSFTWQGAPPCAESNANGAAWCPSFDSTLLAGEGAYEMQFRAVDAVGNETLSPVHTLYVDGTPPTASQSGISDPNFIRPMERVDELRWTVLLQGDLSDPRLVQAGSMAGSGIITESVQVQLVDEVGGALSGTPQKPVITGSTWLIEYEMTGSAPQGVYAVMLTLEDAVGNRHVIPVNRIRVDGRLPNVDLYTGSLPTDVISQSTVLSGTITDLPEWGGTAVEHHFAEPAGTTVFYNTGESQFYTPTHSLCTTCPTAGQPGLFGDAVLFDGVDDAITIPFVFDPITTTFAAAVWISPTQLTGPHTILAQEDGSGIGRSWLAINSAGMLETDLGGAVLSGTTPIVVGEWQHVAVTYDGEIVSLYHNGRLQAAAARTIESTDGDMQLGLSPTGTTPFPGLMDEFNLIHRTLTHHEVYALAQTGDNFVYAYIGLVPVDFFTDTVSVPTDVLAELIDLEGWDTATVSDPNSMATSWQYPLPANLEGFYELHLRGAGGLGAQSWTDGRNRGSRDKVTWRGLIDVIPPTINVTARHITVTGSPVTEYSFIFTDFILDAGSYSHPCAPSESVIESYNDANLPYDGQPYEVSGICQVATHETGRDFTACDAVGHCTTVTATVTDLPQICGIIENQTYDFENVSISIESGGLGDIACLQAGHVEANHPTATSGIRTDSYWIIEAVNLSNAAASSFTATLTMTVPFTPDEKDKLCRYTGSDWDCKVNSFDAENKTITRNNVTAFSPWAVGNDVGPTAVSLGTLSVATANQIWVWFMAFMMGLATAVLWRRRKCIKMNK